MPPKKKSTTPAAATAKKASTASSPIKAGKKNTNVLVASPASTADASSPQRLQKQTGKRVAASPSPTKKTSASASQQQKEQKEKKNVNDDTTKNELANTHATELWETLKIPNTPVNAVADQMVNKTIAVIFQDVDAAVAALLTLVCKGAGLEESLDATRVGDNSNAPTDVSELIARVPNDMQNFPLSEKAATTPLGRRFRRIYAAFWEQLPKTIYAQSLDEYTTTSSTSQQKKKKSTQQNNNKGNNKKKKGAFNMLDDDENESSSSDNDDEDEGGSFLVTIMPWLGLLSDAKARNFRMAASLAMFSYIHGSAKVLSTLEDAVLSTKTKRDATQLEEQINLLRQRIDEMFSASFHVRTRDVASDIRLTSFQCLRRLVEDLPSLFLTNRHIRYFGVALNDKRGEIRLEALETITNLLASSSENATKLQEFIRYFASRIVEMKDDIETRCADLALKTASMIIHTESKLSTDAASYSFKDQNVDTLLHAVTDDRLAIRRAAGVLLRIFVRFRTGNAPGNNNNNGTSSQHQQHMHFAASLCLFGNSLRSLYGEKMSEKYIVDALISPSHPLGLSEAELDALIQIAKFDPFLSSSASPSQSQKSQQQKKGGGKKGKGSSSSQQEDNNQDSAAGAIPDYTDVDVAAAIRILSAVFSIYNAATNKANNNNNKLAKNPSQIFFGPSSKDDLRVAVPKVDDDEITDLVERLVRETSNSVLRTALVHFPESEDVRQAVVEALSVESVVQAFPARANSSINELINMSLKQPTLNGPVSDLDHLAVAWQSLGTFDSSGLKDVASSALQQLTKAESNLKNIAGASSSHQQQKGKKSSSSQKQQQASANNNIEQVLQASSLLADAWARVSMLAGVTNLTAQWAIFEAGLLQQSVLNVADSNNTYNNNSNEDDSEGGSAGSASSVINSFDARSAAYIVEGAYHTILWAIHEASDTIQDMLETAIPRIATITRKMAVAVSVAYDGQNNNNNNNNNTATALAQAHCKTLCAFLDILSLPFNRTIDAKETIEPFIFALTSGIENAVDCHRRLSSTLDSRAAAASFSVLRNNTLRRERTLWESMLARLCAGFARVIVFSRLAPAASQNELDFAAKVMRTWAKIASCSKPAGEIMKQLFHTIREQRLADSPTSDVGALDKAILRAAYDHCINQGGASSVALDEYHAIGSKLATMHMPFQLAASNANSGTITAAERFYPSVPGVVELGIDLAASDDIFLHAVIPYCSRLKQPHARSLIDVLAQNDYFSPQGQGVNSQYARALVTALRKAAKLDGAAASASGSNASIFATGGATTTASVAAVGRVNQGNVGTASVSAAPKRQMMKLGGAALNAPTEDENDVLNEILRSRVAGSRRQRGDTTGTNGQQQQMMMMMPSPHQEQEQSTSPAEQPRKKNNNNNNTSSPVSSTKKNVGGGNKKKVVISATQQSDATNFDEDDDDEMLLATQEWKN